MFKRLLLICATALLLASTFAALPALALDTAGASCTGAACRATDGMTAGGSCTGHYCVAGSAGTAGGPCFGDYCQAGNGGTGGGDCIGDYCKAGNGGTGGGNCHGKGCQAGTGGTVGGSCSGADCKAGNRGQARPGPVVANMGCCMAWSLLNVLTGRDLISACNAMQAQNKSADKCDYVDRQWRQQSTAPVIPVTPGKLPDPPTSLEAIKEATRRPPDPRCPFNCQAWNPASNSCVGAPMNVCDR